VKDQMLFTVSNSSRHAFRGLLKAIENPDFLND
jgi:hypothetical protein